MSEAVVETPPIRLLYIDDDYGLGRLVERTLSRHGFQVRHALSGDEGLNQLAAERFDVIALDHFMPVARKASRFSPKFGRCRILPLSFT